MIDSMRTAEIMFSYNGLQSSSRSWEVMLFEAVTKSLHSRALRGHKAEAMRLRFVCMGRAPWV